ncbi:MAG: ammonia-forming cytochrome c nitrite reductase subunit c552 [Eubacteriales bacterium]|nr:ammonia-forming cytochrome c nitrite reductase subunit c552 [Eubacteriales bacterium]
MKKMRLAAFALGSMLAVGAISCGAAAEEGAIEYKHVDAPVPANENGVVTAEEWSEIYPEIVESMNANADNNYRISYLEEDPYLTNVYEGYGFAIDYTSAISHSYTLEDVHNTERPHPYANCITCKTPDYTKLVNDMGEEAYMYDFEETWSQMNENISCYNCHENQAGNAGQLVVTHSYVTKALGDEMENFDPAVLSCGQCHIEYFFEPDTKATTMPYSSAETMDPEKILAYYNERGFSDWTQESTGTGLLKAQHPEFETFTGAGSVHAGMLNCADCHMAKTTSENGVTYTSHKLESPLENEQILQSCVQCHGDTDMKAKVAAIQEEIVGREKEVGEQLSTLKSTLEEAVTAGEMNEDVLNDVRALYRDAQWYWDFCYVENSEGAHNSTMARRCLNNAETLINAAMARFA